jgi:hypothetical protein
VTRINGVKTIDKGLFFRLGRVPYGCKMVHIFIFVLSRSKLLFSPVEILIENFLLSKCPLTPTPNLNGIRPNREEDEN